MTLAFLPALDDATIPELPKHYRGKVRDNYDLPDGRRIIIASDRVSAFDQNLGAVPCKGQVLTQIARFWFEHTKDICPNHVIEYPDPNVVICKKLAMLPVEIVVRGYLAGTTSTSVLSMYRQGQRVIYGHRFPDGMKPNEKLPQPILTPTTKAEIGSHDEPLSEGDIIHRKLLSPERWAEVSQKALALFARGQEMAAQRGFILADTKYEFGMDGEKLVLADEIHTPDSSRYWIADSYPERFQKGEPPATLDKDFIRNWVAARCDPYKDAIPAIPPEVMREASAVYISLYERITGEKFAPPGPGTLVLERIRKSLQKYF